MRRVATLRIVLAMTLAIVICCAIWSIVVQQLVPNACTYDPPPPNAQYLRCP